MENKCRICGNSEGNVHYTLKEMMFGKLKGMGEEFAYFQCSECGCLQIESYPESMDKYYPESYVSLKKRKFNKLSFIKRFFVEKKSTSYLAGRSKQEVSKYLRWAKTSKCSLDARILDVGCGSGKLLAQYYKLGFKDLTGVDPFVSGDVEFENGIQILKTDIFGIEEGVGKFDFIIMSHTFEHMPRQEETLKRAVELLTENGSILLRIPIADSYAWEEYKECWVNADPPRHFYLHSVKSINLMAEKCGLEVGDKEYEAQDFALYGSEQVRRGINLKDENSYWVNKDSDIFSEEELQQYKDKTIELNKSGRGDFAVFHLFKKND